MDFHSKLPDVQESIFAVMSQKAAKYQAVNLSQGFPDFDAPSELIDLVTHYMKKGCNQYAPMPGVPELRKAISQKVQDCQSTYYSPDTEVTVSSGATQALATAIATLVRPGDEVIVFEPTYDAYIPLIELQGGQAISLELKSPDFKPNWQDLADKISDKTKAIIINTPNNPCGSILDEDDLKQLWEIIKKTDIYLISDEVYEHIVFDEKQHLSISTHEELKKRSFIISSFGKTLHITGWKCGYCLAPENLMKEFQKAHQFMIYSVNTPIQLAIAEYLTNAQNYLSLSSFYGKKRDLLCQFLSQTQFKFTPAASTYFQLIDYTHYSTQSGIDFCNNLVENHGIALIPLEPLYRDFQAPSLVRVCFAKKESTLNSGLQNLLNYSIS
jgi:methionine transaminase